MRHWFNTIWNTRGLARWILLAGDGEAVKDVLQHHVLPCFALGLLLSGVIIRLVRVNVIQAMQGDYVEAARARGIPERQVVRLSLIHI